MLSARYETACPIEKGSMMTESESAQRVRIAHLEAENARLRERERAVVAETDTPKSGRVSRLFSQLLSALLIVVAAVLAPVSIAASWAVTELTDAQSFVETFGPLVDEPAVQDAVIRETEAAISEALNVEALTDDLFDGIESLGVPPKAAAALDLLRDPAAAGVASAIDRVVERVVRSDAFSTVWNEALTRTHRQLTLSLEGDPDAVIEIGADPQGDIGVQLGPIVDRVKAALVADGFALAERIPSIDRTIVIADTSQAAGVQTIYTLVVAVGPWLPAIALVAAAGGVLLARNRRRAVITAAIAVAATASALGVALTITRPLLRRAARADGFSGDALEAVFDHATAGLIALVSSVVVIGVASALAVWLGGPGRAPRAVRAGARDAASAVRGFGEARGVTTGAFGTRLARVIGLLRWVVLVVAAAIVLLVRPIDVADMAWIAVGVLVVLFVLEVLQRPAHNTPAGQPVEEAG